MAIIFDMVSLSNHHPHPYLVRQAHDTALPSREREIKIRAFIGERGGFFFLLSAVDCWLSAIPSPFTLDPEPYTLAP
jgi:hypothetical protein